MPKETFNDQFGIDHKLYVKWGHFGLVEMGVENSVPLQEFVQEIPTEEDAFYGFWLSLSKEELLRLIKVLTRAARQYDERVNEPEPEPPVTPKPTGELPIVEPTSETKNKNG